MKKISKNWEKSDTELSCYCRCERCVFLALSKLDRSVLRPLDEPKFRRCLPCKLKYDLILKRKRQRIQAAERKQKTHRLEDSKMTATEVLVPCSDRQIKEGVSFADVPAIEGHARCSAHGGQEIISKLEKLELSSRILSNALKKLERPLNEPTTREAIRDYPASASALASIPTTSTSETPKPSRVIPVVLDKSETQKIRVHAHTEKVTPEKAPKIITKGVDDFEAAAEVQPTTMPQVQPCITNDAGNPRIDTIKGNFGCKSPPVYVTMPSKQKITGGQSKMPRKKQAQSSYRLSIDRKPPRVSSPVVPSLQRQKHDLAIASVASRKNEGNKYTSKSMDSLSSQSVDEILYKNKSMTLRRKPSSKWGSRNLSSTSSISVDDRPPWYPLRTTNRWDYYEKKEQDSVASSLKGQKRSLVKRKSKNKIRSRPLRPTDVDSVSDYSVLQVTRKPKKKPSRGSEASYESSKSKISAYQDDQCMYYKLKGIMRPRRNEAQPQHITPKTFYPKNTQERPPAHEVPTSEELCQSCLATSSATCSDTDRTCYVSESPSSERSVLECGCNKQNGIHQNNFYDKRQPVKSTSASDDCTCSGCDECNVASENQLQEACHHGECNTICMNTRRASCPLTADECTNDFRIELLQAVDTCSCTCSDEECRSAKLLKQPSYVKQTVHKDSASECETCSVNQDMRTYQDLNPPPSFPIHSCGCYDESAESWRGAPTAKRDRTLSHSPLTPWQSQVYGLNRPGGWHM